MLADSGASSCAGLASPQVEPPILVCLDTLANCCAAQAKLEFMRTQTLKVTIYNLFYRLEPAAIPGCTLQGVGKARKGATPKAPGTAGAATRAAFVERSPTRPDK